MTAAAGRDDGAEQRQILLVSSGGGESGKLTSLLLSDGYEVEALSHGAQVCSLVAKRCFELVILEHPIPGRSGLEICRDIRAAGGQTPIMMITGSAETFEKVVALRLGADDYVTRPIESAELLARVEALIRRGRWNTRPQTGPVSFGQVVVDFGQPRLTRAGELIPVSAKEFQLLKYLVERRGQTVTRVELLREVWGIGFASSTRTLDVHIAALRRKIEDDPKRPHWILTTHGVGYRFRE
jgi:two-component system alkaline phosphatase synthesis response regulator PhoP